MGQFIRKDLKPLPVNPFEGLINAHVNSTPYTPSEIWQSVEGLDEMTIDNDDYVGEYKDYLTSLGWYRHERFTKSSTLRRKTKGNLLVRDASGGASMPERPDLYVQDAQGKWIVNQTVWDEASQSWKPKGEFNPMFIYRPGYTLDYNSMVAFRIPEFFNIHQGITYYMWVHDPATIGYLYLYPTQDTIIPDLIEVPSLIYNNAILWSMYDNLAFYNESLFEDIPRGKLTNGSYYNVNLGGYADAGQFFHSKYSNQLVCNDIDQLPDDLHPLKGNFVTQSTNLLYIAWVYTWFSRIAKVALRKIKANRAAFASAKAREEFFNRVIPPSYVGSWKDYYAGIYRPGDVSFGKLKTVPGQTFF